MKNKIIIIGFLAILFGLPLAHAILPDQAISTTERRTLTQLSDGKFEKYLLDQIPLRETLRSIKAGYNYFAIRRLENNNIRLIGGGIYESNSSTNEKSIDNYIAKVAKNREAMTEQNRVFVAMVPDKNYYLDDGDILKIDYDLMETKLRAIPDTTYIDLTDELGLGSYYATDTHWRQEMIESVAQKICTDMHGECAMLSYQMYSYGDFYGVLYGRAAVVAQPDALYYLSNDILEAAKLSYLEDAKQDKIYVDKDSLDAYDFFLGGASSFIEIENPLADDERELVVFRDSFGSSLIPLLVPHYRKITVIDNRYINSQNYLQHLEFTDQDVLFINSSLVINNSGSLKG